ncbi:hypothetical protein OCU04_002637 [Sclerotinia nivalis]|uniref:Uncharacterized protein n=1 Tax=Sclerotinia nivalis TaxID=352851 RepID=A0A9X0DME4_9HELO|nr:hypothetical protein OCU04_002637 [Sclerotinia nivalis]
MVFDAFVNATLHELNISLRSRSIRIWWCSHYPEPALADTSRKSVDHMRKGTGTTYQAKPLHQNSKRLSFYFRDQGDELRQPSH